MRAAERRADLPAQHRIHSVLSLRVGRQFRRGKASTNPEILHLLVPRPQKLAWEGKAVPQPSC